MSKILSREDIQALVAPEMKATEAVMQQEMTSEVPLAELVMTYALGVGGKRFRPMLSILSAGVCGYHGEDIPLAAAFIEFIHNSTLLHDDVVDESDMRRGQPSANVAFSNAASVLVGDFLYTRSFQLMVRTGNMDVLETMAEATNLVASGEVMQLGNVNDPDVDEKRYYRVIELKTAVLFSAACKVAAQLAGVSEDKVNALADYGKKLGMAFQICDDMLDYLGDAATIGKEVGDDLAEGKPTMPLIRAQKQLPEADKARLREIIINGEREAIGEVITMLGKTDAIAYSHQKAEDMAQAAVEALAIFPENDYKDALKALAFQAVERNS